MKLNPEGAAMSRKESARTNAQWYAEHPAVFLMEVDGLSMEHVGIYAKLRAIYWTNGCCLPEEISILKRKLPGASDAVLQEVLTEFFPDGCNSYLDSKKAEAEALSHKASANARQRWNKGKPNGRGQGSATETGDDTGDF